MDLLSREAETIYAPITAPAVAGVGVIRVSGPQAVATTRKMCEFLPANIESHRVYYGFFKHPKTSITIDEVLVSYFAENKSFTGEETIEISCHGSLSIMNQILNLLGEYGCIAAERGEFTFRAFSNGRIDLVQAESVLSLVHSQSEAASRLAIRQLQGELSKEIQIIEDHITWTLANIEAGIDFTTEDIDVISYREMNTRVEKVVNSVANLVRTYQNTRPIVEGLRVVLVGRPNAGKSSLLNALLEHERAIVTDIPGTTRDLIEGILKLENGIVTLVDTAGLRETIEVVEGIGIRAAKNAANSADLVGYLFDSQQGLVAEDYEYIKNLDAQRLILIGTKSDCMGEAKSTTVLINSVEPLISKPLHALVTSAKERAGIEKLKNIFNQTLQSTFIDDSAVLIQKRHYELLSLTAQKTTEAFKLLKENASLEFVALELQESLSHVHELLGKRYDDQVMDRVFKEFCIGK